MQINYDDIEFTIQLMLGEIASKALRDEVENLNKPLPAYELKKIKDKYSNENIFCTKYSTSMITGAIMAAIDEYHEQLRKKLLELGVDIGEMDISTTPLRDDYQKSTEDDE